MVVLGIVVLCLVGIFFASNLHNNDSDSTVSVAAVPSIDTVETALQDAAAGALKSAEALGEQGEEELESLAKDGLNRVEKLVEPFEPKWMKGEDADGEDDSKTGGEEKVGDEEPRAKHEEQSITEANTPPASSGQQNSDAEIHLTKSEASKADSSALAAAAAAVGEISMEKPSEVGEAPVAAPAASAATSSTTAAAASASAAAATAAKEEAGSASASAASFEDAAASKPKSVEVSMESKQPGSIAAEATSTVAAAASTTELPKLATTGTAAKLATEDTSSESGVGAVHVQSSMDARASESTANLGLAPASPQKTAEVATTTGPDGKEVFLEGSKESSIGSKTVGDVGSGASNSNANSNSKSATASDSSTTTEKQSLESGGSHSIGEVSVDSGEAIPTSSASSPLSNLPQPEAKTKTLSDSTAAHVGEVSGMPDKAGQASSVQAPTKEEVGKAGRVHKEGSSDELAEESDTSTTPSTEGSLVKLEGGRAGSPALEEEAGKEVRQEGHGDSREDREVEGTKAKHSFKEENPYSGAEELPSVRSVLGGTSEKQPVSSKKKEDKDEDDEEDRGQMSPTSTTRAVRSKASAFLKGEVGLEEDNREAGDVNLEGGRFTTTTKASTEDASTGRTPGRTFLGKSSNAKTEKQAEVSISDEEAGEVHLNGKVVADDVPEKEDESSSIGKVTGTMQVAAASSGASAADVSGEVSLESSPGSPVRPESSSRQQTHHEEDEKQDQKQEPDDEDEDDDGVAVHSEKLALDRSNTRETAASPVDSDQDDFDPVVESYSPKSSEGSNDLAYQMQEESEGKVVANLPPVTKASDEDDSYGKIRMEGR
eukprot:CAMPEP_0206504206 /NCGR_PEP_ID=MMETSP0324_2-20121206/55308_1 /ASSEMBLY_ACC=CAM_ASM_000836 /TAXON_ID=2866 /ORGANISM="Crypthecodinium cohnii, Strain Seligo" /LENGTH=830 /DNA_ID=CAMNT_0053993253 /DNA_START=181 /DNA_END=2673 /DNA_ORIENTATION=+